MISISRFTFFAVRSNAPGRFTFSTRMASSSTDDSKTGDKTGGKHKNRLAYEKSPYLLQHASNPVDWYPWGAEALEKARKENKMIFLSVGYSACHWCHVMERESFENKKIAEILNQHFVNIKIDREERPDIEKIYMSFVQMTKSGGWPLNVFLTPDLKPVFGGTYYPPDDVYPGRAGFKTLVLNIAKRWQNNRDYLTSYSDDTLKALKNLYEKQENKSTQQAPEIDCVKNCVQQLTRVYDPNFGGFSSSSGVNSTKFPQPVNLDFLLHVYARNPSDRDCLDMCVNTLTKMAYGGIHDHVGQGFSRYSVDAEWHVPHFEKMLYDQAQLLQTYANAFVATKNPLFSEIVDDIATYVLRDLRHKEGGFYSAEDADSLPKPKSTIKREGAFYVWTHQEITNLLPQDIPGKSIKLSDLFCHHFNVKKTGNVPSCQDHGEFKMQNVLIVYGGIEKTAEHFNMTIDEVKSHIKEACSILFTERSKRPRPHLDDKIVTAWNGLMISGLARAGMVTGNQRYVDHAIDAAKFLEKYLYDKSSRVLLRTCYRTDDDVITQTSVPIHGFQDDYAFAVQGLLNLYEATFDLHWLELAEELQEVQDNLFWDAENGGYFVTSGNNPEVILRLKSIHDGVEPSGNSVACYNLLRLAVYFNRTELELKDKALRILSSFRHSLAELPIALPDMVSALLHYHEDTTQIYIAGKLGAKDTDKLLRVIHERLIPGKVLLFADHDQPDNILFRKNDVISKMKPQNGKTTVHVCRDRTCSLPVTDPDELASLLDDK